MDEDDVDRGDKAESIGSRDRGRLDTQVTAFDDATFETRSDTLAVEEPMEIRLALEPPPARPESIAVTMRTPGDATDIELAVGYLFGESVIESAADVRHASYCLDPDLEVDQRHNVVTITLREGLGADLRRLERNVFASSACGVCGKARLEQLELLRVSPPPPGPTVAAEVLYALPDRLRAAQTLFEGTGGLHAAALFDASGGLIALREDVGRHNAVDKLIGWALGEGRLPLHDHILMVSGRSSFEIMQKALRAGLPMVCAVSAPSSLAVELAERFGMTLVGFLRGERFNVYAGEGRIATSVGGGGRAGRIATSA